MSPKRKKDAEEGVPRKGTLSSASEQGVEKLLKKSRRGGRTDASLLLPLPGRPGQDSTPAACGAPEAGAVKEQEEHVTIVEPDALDNDDDDEGVDWEDVSEDDAAEDQGAGLLGVGGESTGDLNLTIDMTSNGPIPSNSKAPTRRQTYTKRDRELAQLVHCSHLLCLLGRGLLYDAAADDLTVQALMLSLVPSEVSLQLRPGCSIAAVSQAVDWFHSSFKVSGGTPVPMPAPGEDAIEAAFKAAQGVEGIVMQLKDCIENLKGSAEQLATLIAALLRARKVATRTVRRLEPSPLKPGDVAKQQENARKAFMKGGTTTGSIQTTKIKVDDKPNKKAGKHKRKQNKTSPKPLDNNDALEQDGLLKQQQPPSVPIPPSRRRGDDEFERELAIALTATAFQPNTGQTGTPNDSLPQSLSDLSRHRGKKAPGVEAVAAGCVFGTGLLGDGGGGRYWIEAYCGTLEDGKWVHADPALGWVDRADDVEALAPKGQPLSYAVAHAGGGAKDVTRRYTKSMVAAAKLRDGDWWEATLRPLRAAESAAYTKSFTDHAGPSTVAPAAAGTPKPDRLGQGSMRPPKGAIIGAREDRELEAAAAKERKGLPTTIDGFRSHPDYVLKRHVGRHQALKPDAKAVGMHRGEPYYQRSDLGDIHTADRWRRLGREVIPEEMGCPVKQLKKRNVGGNAFGSSSRSLAPPMADEEEEDRGGDFDGELPSPGANGTAMSNFYGVWQTREWVPPAAADGRVPKNERGNVEVPPFTASLPQGTVHINLQGSAVVCKRLGIDFAPALAGFDIRGGRSVPRIEGVVVCIEHEDVVREAVEQDRRHREQLAQEQREAAAEAHWRHLLRAVLTRVRLQRSGGGSVEGAQAEGVAAMLHDTLGAPRAAPNKPEDDDEEDVVDLTQGDEGNQDAEHPGIGGAMQGLDVEEI